MTTVRKCCGLGCVVPLLISCAATPPQVVTAPEVRRVMPPAPLLRRHPAPVTRAETVRDVVRAVLETRAALAECDADMAALIDWAGDEAGE